MPDDQEMKDGGESKADAVKKKSIMDIKAKEDMSISTKKKEDFAPLLATAIPQNRDLALKEGKKAEAVENLLAVEKTTRMAGDAFATGKVAVEIVKIFYETKDWEGINSHIVLISKRRQQLKQVLVDITQEAVTYLEHTPSKDVKLALMETLRAVTDGKIHVELERARLTRQLAKIREDEGKVAEAAELMQEVQVETYGSMDKEEKVDYILEQVRLCLDKGDLVRGTIVSKKITEKTFKDDQIQDLKVRYYDLVVRIHNEKDEYLEMAQAYHHQFSTPVVKDSPERWMKALKSVAVYLVLSPFDNHHHDFLVRILEEKKLDQIKPYKVLLTYFKTMELIQWSAFQAHPRRPAQHPGHGDVLHKHHDGASRAAPRAPARPDREARLRHGRGWDDVVPNRPAQRRRDLHAGQGSYGRPQRMEQQHLGASREGGTDVPPDPQGAVHLHAPGQVSLITSLGQVSLISYPVSDQ
ncbi:hypothetical protein T484DRAFT_2019564 [Baffinella frigidus]|nr:hypothetical protein T484DRAFT_2019564 [Cryptophyta sp. CCMP2293]